MGLTSSTVLVIAIVLAVLLLAATVLWWPRLARTTWQAVLGRIAALLTTQFAVLCAIGLAANNYFAFYSSWDDLLGTGDTGPVSVQASVEGRPATAVPVVKAQVLGKEPVEGGSGGPEQSGEIQSVRITGSHSGLSTDAYVYLPPQYFQPAEAHKRFPAAVVMTGFPGDAKNLITRLNYPSAALQLMQSGKMQPTVLVLMRPSPAMPADTECEDIPGGAQSETYFTKDVPRVVAESYRVATAPSAWGVVGNSTGGYCALKMAMRHPEVFPTAIALSGYYKAAEDATTGDLFTGSQQRRNEADLLWRLNNLPQPKISVLLAGPQAGDGSYKPSTEAFQKAVKAPMTANTAWVPQGGHNFRTWSQLLPPSLEWLSQHLNAGA
ncbi:alpha/beta hydrolase [Kitasatospora sp. DSM 101779]|uniref:alpha/beta hydrolase n=1 Tax=Kitasatospora sp. DSM 101779 TaxID=2853165 RepID=UPI0021D82517|nr:alpha/beta hydrolase-fold protein [Kitasatospora sp. DSM 101779]MCU7821817.1 esterase [Kitasatospora sp. DSM 101779]